MLRAGIILAVVSSCLNAAHFEFGALIRAGLNGSQQWEVAAGVGPNPALPNAHTDDLNPHWRSGESRTFEVGYVKSTNTAFVRVYPRTGNAPPDQATWNPAGGAATSPGALWTLPAKSFYVTAEKLNIPTGITVSNLTFLSGVNIIQPISQTTLSAVRTINTAALTVTESKDVVFRADASGNWTLRGLITLTNSDANHGGGNGILAQGDELRFGLDAFAEAPEPSTVLLTGLGGLVIVLYRKRSVKSLTNSSGENANEIRCERVNR